MRSRGVILPIFAWILGVVIGVVSALWAVTETVVPPEVTETNLPPQLFTVEDAEIVSETEVIVQLVWHSEELQVNRVTGTVTSVPIAEGETVNIGDTLYTVDLSPVVAAVGEIPSFRTLSSQVVGDDVEQLEVFLRDSGYFTGTPDRVFDATTTTAVRRWQVDSGQPRTGVVSAGSIAFFPELPLEVSPQPELRVDVDLVGGERLLKSRSQYVTGSFELDQSVRTEIPTVGNRVTLNTSVGEIPAEVADILISDSGLQTFVLSGPDGGPLCESACEALSNSSGTTTVAAKVELRPSISGPAVPISALGTSALTLTYVLDEIGNEISVEVLASSATRAVVRGLTAGDKVRLFAVPAEELPSAVSPTSDESATPDSES